MDEQMKDEEIIKALECCIKHNSCDGCPLNALNCTARVPMAFAVDLINRQKAEIEEMRNGLIEAAKGVAEAKDLLKNDIAKAKAEAIREFAERFKSGCVRVKTEGKSMLVCQESSFDYLVKEMIGERE